MKSDIITFVEGLNIPKTNMWINEARFGFSHVKEKIEEYSEPLDILEVGCGSGILLSMLSEAFGQHNFEGIEPIADGFASLEELNALVKSKGPTININSYENFQTDKKYDFIGIVELG